MKSFKSALTLVAVAAALFAGAAQAADTASLDISGTVAVSCNISVRPTAKATSLDILNGETAAVVGTVTETCNSGTGYQVSLSSSNRGQLVSAATGSTPTSYTATYDDARGTIDAGMSTTRSQAYFGRTGDLAVSFGGNGQAIAGTYVDTINLVIAAR